MNRATYLKNGSTTTIIESDFQGNALPIGVYSISKDMLRGYILNDRESLDLPKKIYGESEFPNRVLAAFTKLGKGMGVLLSGPKGTGKTVEAKQICTKSNMPVILITQGYDDAAFSEFIESIKTPSIFFIDEFEKIYAEEHSRNFFLSVMDGVAKSRHLFVLTSNSSDIGEYFDSRPGRVRYHKHYDFLSEEIIEEIIADRLVDKSKEDSIKKQLAPLPQLSMDGLVCIIDECNMFNETPEDFKEIFNVVAEKPEFYSVKLKTKTITPKEKFRKSSDYDNYTFRDIQERFRFGKEDEMDRDVLEYVKDNCIVTEVEYEHNYIAPFNNYQTEEDSSATDNVSIYVELYRGFSNDKRSFHWTPNVISKFEQNRKGFLAIHKDGSVMTGTPVKTVRGF